jgi:hypothetical protein
VSTLSGSRVCDASGGAAEAEAERDAEIADDGKALGIPMTCGANADAESESESGATPPSRLPEPAKSLRGVGT